MGARLASVVLPPLLAACSAGEPARPAVPCPPGSEWPQTADAAWLRGAVAEARLAIVSCTGSAYVLRLARGTEIYVWAFGPVRDAADTEETAWIRRVAGTPIYGNAIRAVWIASGRHVWIEAGPTEANLPPISELEPLVAATVRR